MDPRRNLLLIADIGYASPYWLDYCRILQEELGWSVKVITPEMNRWQKKFFDVSKIGSVEILETANFPMFYRRNQGMPRCLRIFSSVGKLIIAKTRNFFHLKNTKPFALDHNDWVPLAVSQILQLNNNWKIDAMISTCLPFETHVIASEVYQCLSVPWIADYRDPYSYSHTRLSDYSSSFIEREMKIISKAAACTTTSLGFSDAIKKVYGGSIHVLHNGFDEVTVPVDSQLNTPIEILYQGSIYKNFQDISIVLDALDQFYSGMNTVRQSLTPIRITFGGFSTHIVAEYFTKNSRTIPGWVKLQGLVNFQTAKRMQQKADFVLLLNWEDHQQPGVMQTKLYEYLSSGTPIISTGGSGRDETAEIVLKTNTGQHFKDAQALSKYLEKVSASRNVIYNPNYSEIEKYSRSNQARFLSELLINYLSLDPKTER